MVLLVPDYDSQACSSAQDDLVVKIHTDEGIVGIGETDTNPWVAKAMIEAPGTHCVGLGLKEMLVGQDPLQTEALWEKLYVGSFMTGRRGLGICAMGALDMALWDIRGKAAGKPVWELLGGAKRPHLTPYASLLPTGRTLKEYQKSLVDKALRAQAMGFRAIKIEVCIKGPYAHNAIQEDDQAIVDTVAACRKALGPKMTMMVDVCYCWTHVKEVLWVLDRITEYDIFFIETPLPLDDLDAYARLVDQTHIRVSAGEMNQTRFEFLDLMDRGKLDVVQPDVGRVGGFTEAKRVVDLAMDRGRLCVPHCWKTGIGIAASAHLCAAAFNCPYFEFLPAELSESQLRRELVSNDLQLVDGNISLPQEPGLGIKINERAIEKYRVA